MLVLHDPLTLTHKTVEFAYGKLQPAPECPERISAILKALQESGAHEIKTLHCPISTLDNIPSNLKQILLSTHDPNYVEHLATAHDTWVKAGAIGPNESILPECFPFATRSSATVAPRVPTDMYARAGYYAFDMSTGIMASTFPAAIASAALALSGAEKLLSQSQQNVLCLCRPPGHHCDARRAGGFCYINNAVIAATALQTMKLGRPAKVSILDIDFHHGNGTQEYFYESPSVFYASIHGEDEFPYYTGYPAEIGSGSGKGFNLNLPLRTGSSIAQYLKQLNRALSQLSLFRSDFLILSLGFDTFTMDPLGNFKIDTEDYETIARTIREQFENVPTLILLEGGYVLEKLGANMLSFLKGWETPAPTNPYF